MSDIKGSNIWGMMGIKKMTKILGNPGCVYIDGIEFILEDVAKYYLQSMLDDGLTGSQIKKIIMKKQPN